MQTAFVTRALLLILGLVALAGWSSGCSSSDQSRECSLDGECGDGQRCGKGGLCRRADPSKCDWDPGGNWRKKSLWEAQDEVLLSAATSSGPDNSLAVCLHTWAAHAGDGGADRLRFGIGDPGELQMNEVEIPETSSSPSCIDVGFAGDTAVFLVAVGGVAVLISSKDAASLDAAVKDRQVVARSADLTALGELDRHTRGDMVVDAAGVRRVLLSLGHGVNLLFVPAADGWRQAWGGWEPGQYFTGAPSFVLPGVSGIAPELGFVALQVHASARAGVLTRVGQPTSMWSARPFAVDALGGPGYPIYAWVSPTGEAQLLVSSPAGADGTRALSFARRLNAGIWEKNVVLPAYEGYARADRSVAASAVLLPSGATTLFVEGSRDGLGDWRGPGAPEVATLHTAWQTASGWRSAAVDQSVHGEHRYVAPAAQSVGCGHPAVSYFDQRIGEDRTTDVRLLYAESPQLLGTTGGAR